MRRSVAINRQIPYLRRIRSRRGLPASPPSIRFAGSLAERNNRVVDFSDCLERVQTGQRMQDSGGFISRGLVG